MKIARVRDYFIADHQLLELLRVGRRQWSWVHMPDLPAGATIHSVYYHWVRQCFVLLDHFRAIVDRLRACRRCEPEAHL